MEPSEKPFVLIARVKVKEGKVKEYLNLAEETDHSVEQTEPDMLFHTLMLTRLTLRNSPGLNYIKTMPH